MSKHIDELEVIESALIALHKTNYHHRVWEEIQARAGVSLDRSGALLLKVVSHCNRNACRMQDIAKFLGIEAPSVTRTVQDLEHAGLLRRKTDPNDKRASLVALTAKGRRQLEKIHQARHDRLSTALQEWPKEEQQQLGALLQRFADDLANVYK